MSRPPSRDLSIGHGSRSFEWLGIPGWTVLGYFREQGGEWLIEEIRIKPRGLDRHDPESRRKRIPRRGVTTELLRALNVAGIRVAIAQHMTWATTQEALPPAIRPGDAEVRTSSRTSRTRPVLSDEFLETVARAWLDEVEKPERGAYTRMLTRFADQASSEQTIKGWLVACRDRGWLAKNTSPGRGRGRREASPGNRLLQAGWRPASKEREEQA